MTENNLRLLDPHCEEVVECLERLLRRARAGEVQGMFYGYWDTKSGETVCGLAGSGRLADAVYTMEQWKFECFYCMSPSSDDVDDDGPNDDD